MRSTIFALLAILTTAQCHKILVVFPMASSSHFTLGSTLARGLAEAGNDVTLVGPFEDKTKVKNGKYTALLQQELADIITRNDFNMFEQRSMTVIFTSFNEMMIDISSAVLDSVHIKRMLKNKETFDIVIIEEFMMDSLKVLPYLFKAHFIPFSPMGVNTWINPLVGNPSPLAYMPEMNSGLQPKMNFIERVQNVLGSTLFGLIRDLTVGRAQKQVLQKYYPDAPCLDELRYNASLVLLNSNPGTMPPLPLVPSMIPIGGYHVQPPKPLPKDLQDYIDNAKDGVVYFSMGSVLKSKNMPKEKINVILNAFKQLKEKVIWKWEDDQLEGKPENVKIGKWLPQSSILAHPNVKLFITHGGLLSTTETIYHGKPVLAIPIFGDQPGNALQMKNSGFGLIQSFDELNSAEAFLSNIRQMLDNPKYYNNAQHRSKIFHDLPMKPMDTINFWVDYVMRHNGARHLRVAGMDLTWYQNALLDVWAFIIGVVALVLGGFYYLIKKCCCGGKKSKQVKAKQH